MALWEALAILVALRVWAHVCTASTVFEFKTDNLGMAFAHNRKYSRDSFVNMILREIAITEARVPGLKIKATHVLGEANVWPDALSRIYEPGKNYKVPEELRNVLRADTPTRDTAFWLL